MRTSSPPSLPVICIAIRWMSSFLETSPTMPCTPGCSRTTRPTPSRWRLRASSALRGRGALGGQPDRDERALRRPKVLGSRLLGLAGEIDGRGARVDPTRAIRRRRRGRDSASFRGRGFRQGVHARASGAGRATPRPNRPVR